MELLRQLWRGDVSLARTYWIFHVLVGVLFSITWAVVENNFARWFIHVGQIPVYLFLALALAYVSFIYVAVWRSSNKYQGPKVWSVLAKAVVIIGFLFLAANFLKSFLTSANTTESVLQESALFLNKSLPVMVDEITKLNSVSADGKQLTYHYQIIDKSSLFIQSETFKNKIRPVLANQTCGNDEMQELLHKGVTFTYKYTGHNDAMIAAIEITQADCN